MCKKAKEQAPPPRRPGNIGSAGRVRPETGAAEVAKEYQGGRCEGCLDDPLVHK